MTILKTKRYKKRSFNLGVAIRSQKLQTFFLFLQLSLLSQYSENDSERTVQNNFALWKLYSFNILRKTARCSHFTRYTALTLAIFRSGTSCDFPLPGRISLSKPSNSSSSVKWSNSSSSVWNQNTSEWNID